MGQKTKPAPRPALQKAPDSVHHPALAGASRGNAYAIGDTSSKKKTSTKQGAGPQGQIRSKPKPEDSSSSIVGKAGSPKAPKGKKARKGKKNGKGDHRNGSVPDSLLGAGRATSDSVLSPRSATKTVSLTVSLPKPLRKEIKRRAGQAGMSVDEFVGDVMASWLGGGRWW